MASTHASAPRAPATTPLAATTQSTRPPPPRAQRAARGPAATRPHDCQALGMTRQKLREGPCTHGGLEVYVANKGTAVPLREMAVRLNGFGIQATDPGHVDAVLSLTITNRLGRRVAYDAGSDQTVLELGAHRYLEDRKAENVPGPSFAWRNAGIAPGKTQTGTVVFHIPRSAARRLSTLGSLVATQFTDAGRGTPRQRIAVLRTYR